MPIRINHRNSLFSIGIHPSRESNVRTRSRTHQLVDELYRNTLRRQKESDTIRRYIESLKENANKLKTDVNELRNETNRISRNIGRLGEKIKNSQEEDNSFDSKMRKRYKKTKYRSQSLTYQSTTSSEKYQILYITYKNIIQTIEIIFKKIISVL